MTAPSNSLAMDITSSVIDGVVTAVAVNPAKTNFKPPGGKAPFKFDSKQAFQTDLGIDYSQFGTKGLIGQ